MTFSIGFHVPTALQRESELQAIALALQVPVPASWDESQAFAYARQAQALGEVLVRAMHFDLHGANIAYVFREKIKARGRVIWGRANTAGARLEFFAERDFVLEFNWEQWRLLAPMQKLALVDHELLHCSYDENEKTGDRRWTLVPHDIEEFGAIVTRWGLWRPDLMAFAGAVAHAHQLGLFDGSLD